MASNLRQAGVGQAKRLKEAKMNDVAIKLPFDLLIFPNGMFAKRLLTPVHGFRSPDTERFNDDDLCRH